MTPRQVREVVQNTLAQAMPSTPVLQDDVVGEQEQSLSVWIRANVQHVDRTSTNYGGTRQGVVVTISCHSPSDNPELADTIAETTRVALANRTLGDSLTLEHGRFVEQPVGAVTPFKAINVVFNGAYDQEV